MALDSTTLVLLMKFLSVRPSYLRAVFHTHTRAPRVSPIRERSPLRVSGTVCDEVTRQSSLGSEDYLLL